MQLLSYAFSEEDAPEETCVMMKEEMQQEMAKIRTEMTSMVEKQQRQIDELKQKQS